MPQQYVPNTYLPVPVGLQYKDANGNYVSSLLPLDYLTLVGQDLAILSGTTNLLANGMSFQSSQINYLLGITQNIPPVYNTPTVSPLCLGVGCSGCTALPIDQVLESLVVSWCNYVAAIGSIGNINTVIGTECANLNGSTAFSGGIMSGIPGWINVPTTLTDSLKNMWLTICDLRTGVTNALAAVTPTCSQVIVNFAGLVVSYSTGINLFFDGYTFIPSGFTDNGSTVVVSDSAGNTYTTAINLVTASTTSSAFNIPLTGTSLLPTSNYTVKLNSSLNNATLGLTCQKTTIITLTNNISSCPTLNVTPSQVTATFIFTPLITQSIKYRVDLYDASGVTSLQNTSFVNPTTSQTYTFSGLSRTTTYNLRITSTIIGSAPVTCPFVQFTTL